MGQAHELARLGQHENKETALNFSYSLINEGCEALSGNSDRQSYACNGLAAFCPIACQCKSFRRSGIFCPRSCYRPGSSIDEHMSLGAITHMSQKPINITEEIDAIEKMASEEENAHGAGMLKMTRGGKGG